MPRILPRGVTCAPPRSFRITDSMQAAASTPLPRKYFTTLNSLGSAGGEGEGGRCSGRGQNRGKEGQGVLEVNEMAK
ncbi:hypothetical protein E2C01_095501 [Portunus trituberculatus]|uniref:Uncharacterized protein n=1 Tax=Portunus trituberculatus TaxID=210409 RepID=A0A5B7JVF3_PORTR|nr:hypothetical protein [Portunus trituberculatus]